MYMGNYFGRNIKPDRDIEPEPVDMVVSDDDVMDDDVALTQTQKALDEVSSDDEVSDDDRKLSPGESRRVEEQQEDKIVMSKTDFDPYTGTEYQHDFYHYGFKKSIIEESKKYQEYVDEKHLYVGDKSKNKDGQEWVYTDDGLYKFITGKTKTEQQQQNDEAILTTQKGKKIYTYKVKIEGSDGKRGVELANALGIENNSIIIVDTDNGIIKKRFKKSEGNRKDFNLYYFMHPIISSDSAGKSNYSTDRIIFTNGIPGAVNCYALMCRQELVLNCTNTQLSMNYNVRIKPSGATEVLQEWMPVNEENKTFTTTRFLNANKANNRGSCGVIAQTLIGKNKKSLMTETQYKSKKYTYDDAILALMRKRSGDLFQGFLTKHFRKMVGSSRARIYSRVKEGKRPTEKAVEEVIIQEIINKGGDIITVTGDYPYLSWCLENGVNVLFRAPGTSKILYFKKQ